MHIIKYKTIFLSVAAVLVVAAWCSVFIFGLQFGIDLKGGTQWIVAFPDGVSRDAVQTALEPSLSGRTFSVKETESGVFTIRLPESSETDHQIYWVVLQNLGTFEEQQFSSIGPTIGTELRRGAVTAIILVLFGISAYIAWAFRKVSRPISSWKYGFATLISLFHDVSIPFGFLAFIGAEIDTNIIVALLVVMGFSVHDTIVVFDRIRENVKTRWNERTSLADLIDQSIRETIVRSINTSLTLVLVLVALLIWGPESLFFFLLALLIGTVFGTYSSIFIASPLVFLWRGK